MHYKISYSNPQNHFVDIVFTLGNVTDTIVELQLPSWRPGRYELGNFAKNIQQFTVLNEKGESLPFKKITKDRWAVTTNGAKTIQVKYNYCARQLDAGACWLDEKQLYINPVHCCL